MLEAEIFESSKSTKNVEELIKSKAKPGQGNRAMHEGDTFLDLK